MVIDSNNQIAFTNVQSRSFPQAESEKKECVLGQEATESKFSPNWRQALNRKLLGSCSPGGFISPQPRSMWTTHLDNDAGLGGFLTVPQ